MKTKKMNHKIARAAKRRLRVFLRKHSSLHLSLIRKLPYRMLTKKHNDIQIKFCLCYHTSTIPEKWQAQATLDWELKKYVEQYQHKKFSSMREFYNYVNRENQHDRIVSKEKAKFLFPNVF